VAAERRRARRAGRQDGESGYWRSVPPTLQGGVAVNTRTIAIIALIIAVIVVVILLT
jgi:hypothetical protein